MKSNKLWILLMLCSCNMVSYKSIQTNITIMKNNDLITDVQALEGSPFTIVKYEDNYFLALGKYRVSDLIADKEEVEAMANDVSWNVLLAVINAVAQEVVNENLKPKSNGKAKEKK